jgi:arylsulfatase A-like enzyme
MRNVILLTIDTLRRDVLGCYGRGFTPFLDSIQDRCIQFNQAYSTGPYTQAAFTGILTSSYYLEYGKQKMLSWKRLLISEVLQKTGITTAGFHSNPYISTYLGWNRGWDVFYDSMADEVDEKTPYIKAIEINRKVDTWLSSHVRAETYKPFFLWVHYMDVHEPYVPDPKYIDIVDPSLQMNEDEMFRLFKDVLLKRDVSDRGKVEVLRKLYRAHVRQVDDALKDFFGILEKWNLLKESWVILTTDHGDEFGEHGGLSHDGKMYSELVHVPLIIYEPIKEQREMCNALVSTIDIPPTIVYLFGLRQENHFQGHSLLPLSDYPVRGVFGEAMEKQGSHENGEEKEIHYSREGDFKIIYRERDDSWELYNLKVDPKEMNNIIEGSPQAEAMRQKVMPRVRRFQK